MKDEMLFTAAAVGAVLGGFWLLLELATAAVGDSPCVPLENSIELGTYVADVYDGVLCEGDL